MKKWWIVVLALSLASAAHAGGGGGVVDVKDDEGKTVAHLVMCSSCKDPAGGKDCVDGAVDGWLDGKPCGSCMVKSNWGVVVRYSRDLMVAGRLVKADGAPAGKHYFKVFMPNGWGHRTQADEEGKFKLRMPATHERQKGDPVLVDLGDRVDFVHGGTDQFSVYMLPEAYTPCPEETK